MKDYIFKASQKERARLILFHGYGANGENLAPCGEYLHQKNPNLSVIVPDGHECFEGSSDRTGRQWFSLSAFCESDLLSANGYVSTLQYAIERSARVVAKRFESYMCDSVPLILAGFSQGAALACHLGLLHMPCSAVLGFSGFYRIRTQPVYFPKFWLYHGAKDDVVPLKALEFTCQDFFAHHLSLEQWVDLDAAHNISIDGLNHASAFLERTLNRSTYTK
ncbi:alpha/beta hydrolase [Holospora obtusa]|nr:hypothetical protein [Holospora obtusa]